MRECIPTTLLPILTIGIWVNASARADEEGAKAPTSAVFRAAAAKLLTDPYGPEAETCLKIVAVFVVASEDVQVLIDGPTLAICGIGKDGDKKENPKDDKDVRPTMLM